MRIDEGLRAADFEVCFAGEPNQPTEPADDVARGERQVRRWRTQAAGAVATAMLVVLAVGLVLARPAVPLDAEPAEPVPSAVPSERTFLLPPDADQRILYDGGIYSDPLTQPPPQPAVPRAAALDRARASWSPEETPLIALRMVHSPSRIGGISRVSQPYWVVVWPDSEPAHMGGPALRDPEAQKKQFEELQRLRARLTCASTLFVDADSGSVHGIWQACAER